MRAKLETTVRNLCDPRMADDEGRALTYFDKNIVTVHRESKDITKAGYLFTGGVVNRLGISDPLSQLIQLGILLDILRGVFTGPTNEDITGVTVEISSKPAGTGRFGPKFDYGLFIEVGIKNKDTELNVKRLIAVIDELHQDEPYTRDYIATIIDTVEGNPRMS